MLQSYRLSLDIEGRHHRITINVIISLKVPIILVSVLVCKQRFLPGTWTYFQDMTTIRKQLSHLGSYSFHSLGGRYRRANTLICKPFENRDIRRLYTHFRVTRIKFLKMKWSTISLISLTSYCTYHSFLRPDKMSYHDLRGNKVVTPRGKILSNWWEN